MQPYFYAGWFVVEEAEYKMPTFSVINNKVDILEKTPDAPEATRNHDEMTSHKPLSLEVNSESIGELEETEMTKLVSKYKIV